jgi:mycothiol system anti-sigma-R factor
MRCDEARLAVYAQEDGELDRAGRVELAVHLDRCPACRRDQEADRRVRALVRRQASTMPGAPPDLWSRVLARVEAEHMSGEGRGTSSRPRRRLGAGGWVVAAAAVVTLALAVTADLSPPAGITPGELAGEIVADHARSLRRADGPADIEGREPAVILARLGPAIADIPRASKLEVADATLVGGSFCRLRAAHGIRWSYQVGGARTLSFYQLVPPAGGGYLRPHAERTVLASADGMPAYVLWTDRHSLYALVGALPRAELHRLAARDVSR